MSTVPLVPPRPYSPAGRRRISRPTKGEPAHAIDKKYGVEPRWITWPVGRRKLRFFRSARDRGDGSARSRPWPRAAALPRSFIFSATSFWGGAGAATSSRNAITGAENPEPRSWAGRWATAANSCRVQLLRLRGGFSPGDGPARNLTKRCRTCSRLSANYMAGAAAGSPPALGLRGPVGAADFPLPPPSRRQAPSPNGPKLGFGRRTAGAFPLDARVFPACSQSGSRFGVRRSLATVNFPW